MIYAKNLHSVEALKDELQTVISEDTQSMKSYRSHIESILAGVRGENCDVLEKESEEIVIRRIMENRWGGPGEYDREVFALIDAKNLYSVEALESELQTVLRDLACRTDVVREVTGLLSNSTRYDCSKSEAEVLDSKI